MLRYACPCRFLGMPRGPCAPLTRPAALARPSWPLCCRLKSPPPERVFSLLKLMFGDMQMSALADMIQSALMLRYNKRKVG